VIQFIAKRLWYGLWVLFGVITVIFFLFTVLPGDPARMMLGQRADIASVEAIQRELGLDRPVGVQYLNYLNDLSPLSVHKAHDTGSLFYFDDTRYPYIGILKVGEVVLVLKYPYLRRSYQSNRNVSSILAVALPNTILLAAVSIVFALCLGIILGLVAALNNNIVVTRITQVFSVFGMSLPSFFAAIIFAWLFAFVLADYTGLNMTGSIYEVDDFGRGEYLALKNIVLPAITLGIRPLAVVTELTRTSLRQAMAQDYIRTARAKGLTDFAVVTRHALKNALNPVVTAVSGWFASLLAGAVFVEFIFDWKGIGVVIVEALDYYDFPVVMGAVMVISVMLVLLNIFVDIIYGYLDPRVRMQ
jgi:peptide/nickel transport system permease protein